MLNLKNYQDLLLRCLIVALASIVLTLTSQKNQFDLHFKLRKSQSISEKIKILNVGNIDSVDKVIEEINSLGGAHIFVSQFLSEVQSSKVTIYSIDEPNNQNLSFLLKPDNDGIIRKLILFSNPVPKILNSRHKTQLNINFRSDHDNFETLNYEFLATSKVSLKGKIVIITTNENQSFYTTPVGLLSESEVTATLLDNFIENRFIHDQSLSIQFLVLLITLFISLFLLIFLPSTLALLSTCIFTIFYASLSLWIFDHFNIWTPLFIPILQNFLTFLLVSNYKSVLNERTRWNLEKESLLFDEVEEMKTNFLSLFSHDLKTPLAKIIGLTETLQSQVNDPKISENLEKIYNAAEDLEKYIKRILKMSQVQSKKMALTKQPEDLNNLIKKAVEQNLFFAGEKNITIESQLSPLFMIDIDASLIQEVLVNLIENAIKYSPNNSHIRVISEEYKNYIKISVIDQGSGIPKELQDNIWEKYYRLDKSESGYGLGLFLSRYVVQLHKGQVFLNSKENEGSEFGFILPIHEEKANE
jgi:two-component system, OmpR family, phosphate regulon sensor histidine kinase PhoR